VSKHPPHK